MGKEHSIIDTDMIEFMGKEHLVRFCIEGKIHTAEMPTSQQLRKIYTVLTYRSSPFEIILSNKVGMTLAQYTVSGPSMSKLVEIFKAYSLQNQSHFSEDEFCVQEDEKHYLLVFRPAMKCIGKMNKKSKMIKIDPQYKEANKLFYKLIKAHILEKKV